MTVFLRIFCLPAFLILAAYAQASPKLNGIAIHTELSEDQFIAAIYSETLTNDAKTLLLSDEDKTMEIKVLANTIYARRFARMWIEGIAINAGAVDLEKHAQHLADFSNFLRFKLKAGDIIKIERLTGKGTRVELNGTTLGTVEDAAFFDLLLRTWIGPVPLSSSFRLGLLKGGAIEEPLQQQYASIMPTPERIAAVAEEIRTGVSIAQKESAQAKRDELARVRAEQLKQQEALKSEATALPAETLPPTELTTANPVTTDPTDGIVETPQEGLGETPQAAIAETPEAESVETPKEEIKEGLVSEATLFANEDAASEEAELPFTAEGLLSQQVYISKLAKWTGNYVSYPRAAQNKGQEGTVRLKVTIGRDGKILDLKYTEKSTHEVLNRAATKAVKKASPYPAMPDVIAGDSFVFTVPVVFRLK